MVNKFAHLSNVELRLDLAELEWEQPRSHRAHFLRQDKIDEIVEELLERGAY